MPKVIIGSSYRAPRYERRTPMEYSSLRPEMSADAIRLQRALMRSPKQWVGDRRVVRELLSLTVVSVSVAGIIAMLIAVGSP